MAQKIYVVGIGPGAAEDMTGRAAAALSASDVIAGYQTYIDLVRPAYPDKEYISNGMTKEVDRCRLALETAKGGKTVALISSGDAGVYGMAGLDIVRAALEGHRPGPPVDQGLEKGAGDGGLAAPAGGGAEEQTGRAHARPSPEKIQTGFWASIRW